MDIILDFIILVLLYFICFFRTWKAKGQRIFWINTLIYIYLVFVLYFTLMPFVLPIPGGNRLFLNSVNLIPFNDLIHQRSGALLEIVLNVLMMLPFGFLLSMKGNKKVGIVVLYTFLLSLFIETMQLLYVWSGSIVYRSFDITDLMTNILGGSLGILIYISIKKQCKRKMSRK